MSGELTLDGIGLNLLIFTLSPHELAILLSSRPQNDVSKWQKGWTVEEAEVG